MRQFKKKWWRIVLLWAVMLFIAGCGRGNDGKDVSDIFGDGIHRESDGEKREDSPEVSQEEVSQEEASQKETSENFQLDFGPAELPTPGQIVKSGSWGENITYTLDSNGILTVSGTGKMVKTEGEEYPDKDEVVYLVVEEGVTSITHFSESKNLKYVSLPSTVRVIQNGRFHDCPGLTTVILAEGVSEVENDAFAICQRLTYLVIPSTMSRFGMRAFNNTGIKEIVLPEQMRYIDNSFSCSRLESIKWPYGVDTIYEGTFMHCQDLTSVSLPRDVLNIKNGAFLECSNLRDVYYEGTEEEFQKITIEEGNDALLNATIHYNEY